MAKTAEQIAQGGRVALKDHQQKASQREYVADLNGKPVRMKAMTGRVLIAIQRGTMTESDILEATAAAVLFPKQDLGIDDPLDLDFDELGGLLTAWGDAMKAVALPNTNGAT